MSIIKTLLREGVRFDSTDEVANFLKSNGIDLDHTVDYYIDSGANGDVYKVKDKEKVIKLEKHGDKLYNILKKMKEMQSDYVVKIYFLDSVSNYMVIVMDFLEDADPYIKPYRSKFFETLIMYIEEFIHDDNKFSRMYSLKNTMRDKYGVSEDTTEKFLKTFRAGAVDGTLVKGLISIIFNNSYRINDMSELLTDCINNVDLIHDIYYAILDMMDNDIFHGDIHLDNILYNKQKQNFQLIDPWAF